MWKVFVPLIVGCCFPKGEGLSQLWLLSTIATAIATWLGALSRSHGKRAHRGGFTASVVLRKSTRGRYTSATQTREKGNTRKTVHRVRTAHFALGSPICVSAAWSAPSAEELVSLSLQPPRHPFRVETEPPGNAWVCECVRAFDAPYHVRRQQSIR